jgi:hypothetical protein
MKKIISSFLLFFALLELNCQVNLVPNPSFEDTISCPTGLGDFNVLNWNNPTLATPDYFNSCTNGDIGVPINVFGFQNARTGSAYVGMHTSDFSSTDYREYIQCQLISPLESGKYYEVSFFVSRTDSSTKACDNIGAFLSSNNISLSDNQNFPYLPQIVSKYNIPITDNIDWVQIIDTLIAVGDEQYLTIGVFSNNENTNWIPVSGGWEFEAHYYFDDVSVKLISSSAIDENNQIQISLFPNPVSKFLYVNSPEYIENIFIRSTTGQIILDQMPLSKNFKVDISQFSEGIYFVTASTNNYMITNKIIVKL